MKCTCGARIARTHRFCVACGLGRPSRRNRVVMGLALATLVLAGLFLLRRTPEPPVPPVAEAAGSLEPADRLALVDRLTRAGALEGALIQLDALLASYPDYAYGLRLKAHLQRDSGAWSKAVASYLAYLAVQPEDGRTRHMLALAYLKTEQYAAAVEQCRLVLKAHPRYVDARRTYATGLNALNQVKAAEQELARVTSQKAEGLDKKPAVVFLERLPNGVVAPKPRREISAHLKAVSTN